MVVTVLLKSLARLNLQPTRHCEERISPNSNSVQPALTVQHYDEHQVLRIRGTVADLTKLSALRLQDQTLISLAQSPSSKLKKNFNLYFKAKYQIILGNSPTPFLPPTAPPIPLS